MSRTTKDTYEITWLGYNEAPNYNSIWGIVVMADKRMFAFWGVRNGKIMFKRHMNEWDLRFQTQQKEAKGFKKIDPLHYEMICPKFHEDFEIWLTTAILSDDF